MSAALVIDPADPAPAFEQIRVQVVGAITAGDLPSGAQLPTVRQLARDLGLNHNTVAKAYQRLELEGWVATRGRNGTVVRERPAALGEQAGDEVEAASLMLARAAQRAGLGLDQAVAALRHAW